MITRFLKQLIAKGNPREFSLLFSYRSSSGIHFFILITKQVSKYATLMRILLDAERTYNNAKCQFVFDSHKKDIRTYKWVIVLWPRTKIYRSQFLQKRVLKVVQWVSYGRLTASKREGLESMTLWLWYLKPVTTFYVDQRNTVFTETALPRKTHETRKSGYNNVSMYGSTITSTASAPWRTSSEGAYGDDKKRKTHKCPVHGLWTNKKSCKITYATSSKAGIPA